MPSKVPRVRYGATRQRRATGKISVRLPVFHTYFTGLRITGMPRRTEIVDQARELCKDYLQLKLKRAGLSSRKLAEHDEPLSDVSVEIQRLAVQLEVLFPNLYRNICKQLNVRLSSDEVLRTNFAAVAEQIFKGDITWGKIVSLFSLAGAFAVDCVQCGHAEYMNTIVSSFENFVDTNLSEWIAMQGGWVRIYTSVHIQ